MVWRELRSSGSKALPVLLSLKRSSVLLFTHSVLFAKENTPFHPSSADFLLGFSVTASAGFVEVPQASLLPPTGLTLVPRGSVAVSSCSKLKSCQDVNLNSKYFKVYQQRSFSMMACLLFHFSPKAKSSLT